METEIWIPPYDILEALWDRNCQERIGLEALLRLRARQKIDQSNRAIRIRIGDLQITPPPPAEREVAP
jgi:hypothetical protein